MAGNPSINHLMPLPQMPQVQEAWPGSWGNGGRELVAARDSTCKGDSSDRKTNGKPGYRRIPDRKPSVLFVRILLEHPPVGFINNARVCEELLEVLVECFCQLVDLPK